MSETVKVVKGIKRLTNFYDDFLVPLRAAESRKKALNGFDCWTQRERKKIAGSAYLGPDVDNVEFAFAAARWLERKWLVPGIMNRTPPEANTCSPCKRRNKKQLLVTAEVDTEIGNHKNINLLGKFSRLRRNPGIKEFFKGSGRERKKLLNLTT